MMHYKLILSVAAVLLGLAIATPAHAQPAEPTTLFASDEPIRLSIRGDLSRLARASGASPGTLTVMGDTPETHSIQLSPRGVSRRRREICTFPPLRVELPSRPESGLFEGQRRLKLVTHCRRQSSHQQYVLLEYAAYRLFNTMTSRGFRVRLAEIDYYRNDDDEPSYTLSLIHI